MTMNNQDMYYQMLGLEPGASLDEINQAYKDLAFIWHPDRIPKDNERLIKKAVAKLQEINHAREQLRLKYKTAQSEHSCNKSYHYQSHHQSHYQQSYSSTASAKNTYSRPYHQDLRGADLRGANLREKDLSRQNLSHANLSHADLTDGFLHRVILEKANLYQANLFRANLLGANLREANLQEANLIGADLSGADLSYADLRGAKIGKGDRLMVKLTAVNLSGTIMPDGTIHP